MVCGGDAVSVNVGVAVRVGVIVELGDIVGVELEVGE